MSQDNIIKLIQPAEFSDPLTEVLREGARALLAQAVEAEVAAFLSGHAYRQTEDGRQRLVRHGHRPERKIITGLGPVPVRVLCVRHGFATALGLVRAVSGSRPRSCRLTRAAPRASRFSSRSCISGVSPAATLRTHSQPCSARMRVGYPRRASPD